jgi:hypothetical protein
MNAKKRTKYELPVCCPIPGFRFDIERLVQEVKKIEEQFVDVVSANKLFCSNNLQLVDNVYNNFEQITLTTYNGPAIEEVSKDVCQHYSETLGDDDLKGISKIGAYRLKIKKENLHPALNEHNYNFPTELYKNSYFEEIVNMFKSKAIRVRLTKLNGNSSITPHIDYDPSYAVRVLVPIISNDHVINKFWVRGEEKSYNLPANGDAYFLNTGFKHSVENNSDQDRICLMFSLEDQEDIAHL